VIPQPAELVRDLAGGGSLVPLLLAVLLTGLLLFGQAVAGWLDERNP
jgi:hypothetical protein